MKEVYWLYGSGASSYTAAGLALNPSTGQISGTPTTAGVHPVTVAATNAAGTTQATLTVTVDATPPAPVLEGGCAATATVGTAFYFYIDAYGNYLGLPAATGYAASGLPAGLSLNASTGEITGTPTGPAGAYTIPVTAFVEPVTTLGGVLTLTVQDPPAATTLPVMTSAAGALGLIGNPFAYTIYDTAFIPAAGSLPAGLSYNAASAVISGYPMAPGTYVVPLATTGTTDGGGSVSRQKLVRRSTSANGGGAPPASVLTICVLAPDLSLPRLTAQPGGGTVMAGSSFTFSAAAVGAPAPTYQWRHDGTTLPGASGASLSLGAARPSDSGTYTVTAVNAAGSATSDRATLLVETTFARWQNTCTRVRRWRVSTPKRASRKRRSPAPVWCRSRCRRSRQRAREHNFCGCELFGPRTERLPIPGMSGDYPVVALRGRPVIACNLAVVYAWTGQPDAAGAVRLVWSGQAALQSATG